MGNNLNKAKEASSQTAVPDKLGNELGFATKEAFNLLRTNITFAFTKDSGTRIIGVTSPCPQEGKSYISINLAYSLAEAGYKVIVIDADMRRPSIYKKLGKPSSPGLSNLLVGVESNVIYDGILHENLSVMMSGDIPPNPSELLGSTRMKATLALLAEKYDYIIADLPPVEAVPDSLVVSKYLDGMILVIKQNYSRRRDVNDVVRQLKYTGVRILGFVYNTYGLTAKRNNKYYYHNSYGHEKKKNSDVFSASKIVADKEMKK